jgi:hypothetical protein
LTEPKIFFAREPNIESLQNSRMQEKGRLRRLINLIMPERILKAVPEWRSPDVPSAEPVQDPASGDAVT